jgi:CheY-like chemotaxis protein
MPRRIVWVEDDAYIISSTVRPLEDRGYHIEIIESMHDALERIDDFRECDLILLDIILPARDKAWEGERYIGLTLLSHLREHKVATPIIVLTVVQNNRIREALLALNVVAILNKPVLPSVLERRVLEVFGEEC